MTISLRIPDSLLRDLGDLAKSEDRPKSYIIRKALETYLAEYGDYKTAHERLKDKDDAIVTAAAFRKRLGV